MRGFFINWKVGCPVIRLLIFNRYYYIEDKSILLSFVERKDKEQVRNEDDQGTTAELKTLLHFRNLQYIRW